MNIEYGYHILCNTSFGSILNYSFQNWLQTTMEWSSCSLRQETRGNKLQREKVNIVQQPLPEKRFKCFKFEYQEFKYMQFGNFAWIWIVFIIDPSQHWCLMIVKMGEICARKPSAIYQGATMELITTTMPSRISHHFSIGSYERQQCMDWEGVLFICILFLTSDFFYSYPKASMITTHVYADFISSLNGWQNCPALSGFDGTAEQSNQHRTM